MAGVKTLVETTHLETRLSHADLVFDDVFLQLTVPANKMYTTLVLCFKLNLKCIKA